MSGENRQRADGSRHAEPHATTVPGRGRHETGRSSVSRRDFLRVGGLSVVGLSAAEAALASGSHTTRPARSCLFVLLAGGASQLETFDPKPTAPSSIRGPMKAVGTALPGVLLSEGLPQLARRLDRCTLVRSLYHDAAPTHETGLQLLLTGGLIDRRGDRPALGSVVWKLKGSFGGAPGYCVVPQFLRGTGTAASTGQQAGPLKAVWSPFVVPIPDLPDEANRLSPSLSRSRDRAEPASARASGGDAIAPERILQPFAFDDRAQQRYGRTRFGRLLFEAVRRIEAGSRMVLVNLFDRLEGLRTFDCHGTGSAPATLFDYRDCLCPQLDTALAAALDDLAASGLLDETLVVVTGEFGRSPQINERSGRDHWPRAWSALLAGAGVPRGAVIGATDDQAAEVVDEPTHAAQLAATILAALDIDPQGPACTAEGTGNDAATRPITAASPIAALFPSPALAAQT